MNYSGLVHIPINKILTFICVLIATLLPGILIILMFQPSFFINLPFSKNIALALAYTLPLCIFNSVIIGVRMAENLMKITKNTKDKEEKREAKEQEDSMPFATAGIMTSFVYYIALAICFFSDKSLKLFTFIGLCLVIELLIILKYEGWEIVKHILRKYEFGS